MKKYNKFDYLNLFIIIISFFIIYSFITRSNNVIYGSIIDYSNQHYLIPDYFRKLFYETHNLFPSYAFNLGMGQNIYNFSYYGLFNPLILISYLLPFIKMSTYLNILSVFVIILDIILIYYFLSLKTNNKKMRFIGSFLFTMAIPLILHSHRHIMFVNYMPFLLLGLISIDKNNKILLMLSILFIITISYFFSIPSLVVLFIYAIFLYLNENKKINVKDFIYRHLKLSLYFIIPILISGILLLPTLKAILNTRFNSTALISLKELIIPNVSFNYFLYNSYSLGLTSIIIIAIISSLLNKNKSYKFLGIIFSLLLIFPLFNYSLNGFMYFNGKVFIPFIPLAILLIIKFIEDTMNKNINFKVILLIFIIISILGLINFNTYYIYIIDSIFTLIFIFLLYKKNKLLPLLMCLSIFSFSICLYVNQKDELTLKNVEVNQYNDNINSLIDKNIIKDDNLYRISDFTNNLYNSNNIRNMNEYKSTMYSSLTNKYYKDFYFNVFEVENPNRNDSIFTDVLNPLFNIFVGNKYFLSNTDVPFGYTLIDSNSNTSLYKNDNVFTLGYASNSLISEAEFNKLSFPYSNLALLNNIVIESKTNTNYENKIIKRNPVIYDITSFKKVNDKYVFNLKEDKSYTIKRNGNNNNLLFIKFKMNYAESCKKGDTSITINGVSNMLTCKGWKYHNKNYEFTYIISSSDELEIDISKGKYEVSDIESYEIDYSYIKDIHTKHDKFIIDKDSTKSDTIKGVINVTKDNSYFNLAVPYDEGYNVYVDGKNVEYEKTNISFIGFKIDKGEHNIEINYTSPWLNIGKVVSIIGILSFIVVLFVDKRCRDEKDINDSSLL